MTSGRAYYLETEIVSVGSGGPQWFATAIVFFENTGGIQIKYSASLHALDSKRHPDFENCMLQHVISTIERVK